MCYITSFLQKIGQRDEKDIVESVAAHQCLTFMIKECKKLFKVPFDMMNGLGQHDDCLINEFGLNPQAHPQELRYGTVNLRAERRTFEYLFP